MPPPQRSTQERVGDLVDDKLLQLLTEQFPDRAPLPGTPLDSVWFAAGQAHVIRYLRECQKQARTPD